MPDSPREAPSTVQDCSRPSRARRSERRPPGERSSETASPDAVSIVTPASPGAFWLAGSSVILTSWRRARAWPGQCRRRGAQRLRLPAQPRAQPAAEQHRGGQRVLAVADGHGGDRAAAARARRAGRRRRRSARATASSAATRGRRRRRARRGRRSGRSRSPTVGSSWESSSTIWASRRSASTPVGVAVRRPHDGREVGDEQRVDDRVELAPGASAPMCRPIRSRADRDVARAGELRGADLARARRSSRGPR